MRQIGTQIAKYSCIEKEKSYEPQRVRHFEHATSHHSHVTNFLLQLNGILLSNFNYSYLFWCVRIRVKYNWKRKTKTRIKNKMKSTIDESSSIVYANVTYNPRVHSHTQHNIHAND